MERWLCCAYMYILPSRTSEYRNYPVRPCSQYKESICSFLLYNASLKSDILVPCYGAGVGAQSVCVQYIQSLSLVSSAAKSEWNTNENAIILKFPKVYLSFILIQKFYLLKTKKNLIMDTFAKKIVLIAKVLVMGSSFILILNNWTPVFAYKIKIKFDS